jgi:hypothetical protein
MNMKIWNFVERVSGIKNAVVYIENTDFEYFSDGTENHYTQFNVEDADSETIEATFLVEAESAEQLEKQKNFMISEYLQGENIKDIIDQS